MRLFGISLTRNGQIENNQFMNSVTSTARFHITEDFQALDGEPTGSQLGGNYFVGFPVPIPSGTGSWFENVTTAKVDATGLLPFEDYRTSYLGMEADTNLGIIPGYKYGFDPLWNVVDTVNSGQYLGNPKPLGMGDAVAFKRATTLSKRILAIYNDSDTALTNVKVKIADQTLKGAICEITKYGVYDEEYYDKISYETFNLMSTFDLVKTDGSNYGPDYAKFWFATLDVLDPQTPFVNEELNIDYLGPAGTKEAWVFAIITQYTTRENGNYAGTDDDYMVLATETEAY
jgi:hypothetical protein